MEALVLLLLVSLVPLYFLPTIVACNRGHHSKGAIFALNLFVGWTFLGWVLSLVWSLTYVIPEVASQARVVPAPPLPRESGPPAVQPPVHSQGGAQPHSSGSLVAGVGLFLLAVIVVGALTGRQFAKDSAAVGMRDVPRIVPKVAPISASYVAPATPPVLAKEPPAIAKPPAAKSVDAAEKVKREAERLQWCRAQRKKPASQQPGHAKHLCHEQW